MTQRLLSLPTFLLGTALFMSACSVAPPLSDQETQIKSDLATSQYMPATRQMRDSIETQELFAQAAFWSNEYDLNPGDLEAAIKLSAAVRKLGNPGRAIEITQTTRALYPRDPYLLAEYAAALIADERGFDAMSVLNEGLSLAPAYGRLWSLKGAALDQQERYAEARKHYDRALRITPNDPNVMANIGLSHALAGDAATAESWLRRASTLPGASASVRQNLVLVLQLQGKTEEAQKLAALTRSRPILPKVRPAHRPAPVAKSGQTHDYVAPQTSFQRGSTAPQARLRTGSSTGHNFTTASEAARAMARQNSGKTAASSAPIATSAQQQAALDQFAKTLQAPGGQSTPIASAATALTPQAYPQNPALAGAPPQTAQQKRVPNRRRR